MGSRKKGGGLGAFTSATWIMLLVGSSRSKAPWRLPYGLHITLKGPCSLSTPLFSNF